MPSQRFRYSARALSPVVGVVLLLAIVVALGAVSASLMLGLAEPNDPAPAATFDVESAEATGEVVIRHDGGDTIDGDRLRIAGVAESDEDAFAGRRVATGTTVTVAPTDDDIELIWSSEERDNSAIIARLDTAVSVPFTARGAYRLLSERSEQAAPADGSRGLLFRIENPTDERAAITGITLDVPENDSVSHAHSTDDTRPTQCNGADDPTRFCSLVQVTNPTGATHGYVAGASAGSLPYTVGSVPGASTDDAGWVEPTLSPGETVSMSVYRFQTGPAASADAAADLTGETVEITVAFDTGETVVIRRALPGGQPEPEPEILEPGDRDFGSGDSVAGDVSAIAGDVDASGDADIAGDLRAGGDVSLDDDATVGGGLIGSDVSLDTDASVGGGVVGSDVDLSGNATVGGAVVGSGDVTVDGSASVGGPITTDGGVDIDTDDGFTGGAVTADGDVDLDAVDLTLDGDVRSAGGEIDIDGNRTTITGRVVATSDDIEIEGNRTTIEGGILASGSGDDVDIDGDSVTVNGDIEVTDESLDIDGDDTTVAGDISAPGSDVELGGDNVTVVGDIDAGSIDCSGADVTIAGQSCSAYAD